MIRSMLRKAKRGVVVASTVVGSAVCGVGTSFALLSAEETTAITAVSTKITDLAAGVLPGIGAALAVGIGISLFVKYVKKMKSAA